MVACHSRLQVMRWVLLAYRLPREPSTPRIGVWRQLRRLGVAQVSDGVVALPLDARTREQLEWLAEEVIEHGGEATIWLAVPGRPGQERDLARTMAEAVDREYARVIAEAHAADTSPSSSRTLARLRRELRRIGRRDYFPSVMRDRARAAVEALGQQVVAPGLKGECPRPRDLPA
jgi:hypothetical protein